MLIIKIKKGIIGLILFIVAATTLTPIATVLADDLAPATTLNSIFIST